MRAALGWAQQQCPGGLEPGLRLAASLAHFWIVRGHSTEGRRWLEELLANSGSTAPSIRARGLYFAGRLAFENADYQHATQRFEEALAVWRSLGDGRNATKTLNALGTIMAAQARFDEARAAFEEVMAVSQATDDHVSQASALVNLGMTARHQKRYDEARGFLEEAVQMFRSVFQPSGENRALHALGNLAADRGEEVAAAGWYRQALALSMDLRDWSSVARCLESLALLIVASGDALRAAQLYAAAEGLREEIGVPVTVAVRPSHDQRVAALENLLGRERFLAAWRYRRSLSPTRAVRLALDGK
jgi:tetratricopeptide (TPR) repeat protein